MQQSWAITPEKIAAAVRRIVDVAHPRRIIVFGSIVSGETDIHSDVDILVVTRNEVESRRAEGVRIRRSLRGISMPMDIEEDITPEQVETAIRLAENVVT